jgi:colanic acid/amylovoran biosynthesis glycosyltransferase
VISFHGFDINVVPLKYREYHNKLLAINNYSNIICTTPSNFLKNKMIALGIDKNKIIVIPNSYNEIFQAKVQNFNWQYGDKLKLLSIGRFIEVKGQKYLLEAFAKLLKYYPNAELTLIGYGELENELKNKNKTLKIEDNVHMMQVEHSKLPKIVSEHHIYIQSSIKASDGAEENLSVATIEAQAMGLPAIVSNIGGLIEIIEHNNNGKIVSEKDSDAIFKALKEYVDFPEQIKKHSINAINIVEEKFNKDKLLNKITHIYKELL